MGPPAEFGAAKRSQRDQRPRGGRLPSPPAPGLETRGGPGGRPAPTGCLVAGRASPRERGRCPMIPVMRPWLGNEEAEAAAEGVASGRVAQGPRVREVEDALAAASGTPHARAVSPCT